MKIEKGLKVGGIYHSSQNNKAVRLVSLDRIKGGLRVATIKHHGQDHLFQSEVYLSDLSKATAEQVGDYFKK
tara:strand:+ start:1610 stop:1825 length:216 start_codon:yes stop_codon:yes gene_type:complete